MNEQIDMYSVSEDFITNNYNKTLNYELVENLIYFLSFYPMLIIIYYILHKNISALLMIFSLIIPIFIMTYFRMKIKKISSFRISILLVSIISFLICMKLFNTYIFGIFLIPWALRCLQKASIKQIVNFNKSNLINLELFLFIQLFLCALLKYYIIEKLILLVSITLAIISIAYIAKIRTVRLSMDDNGKKTFDTKENNIFIFSVVAFSVLIIIFMYTTGIFKVASNITNTFASKLLESNNGTPMKVVSNENNSNFEPMQYELPMNEEIKPIGKIGTILIIISKVIGKIIYIGIISFTILVIVNALLIILKKFKNKEKINIVFEKNYFEKEIREKTNLIKRKISKSIYSNNNERARKLYKNKILSYNKKNIKVNKFLSTQDIEKEILNKTNENIQSLTQVYEKARYSNIEITKEELIKIKLL